MNETVGIALKQVNNGLKMSSNLDDLDAIVAIINPAKYE